MPESGSVSRWNEEKGFGFIVEHRTKDSIYVHRTGLIGLESLHEGDEVQYERGQDAIDIKRGKERATNVRLVNHGIDGGSSGSSAARHGQDARSNSSGRGPVREDRSYGYEFGPYMPEDRPFSRGRDAYTAPPIMYEIGTVKSWNEDKKFGFILPDRGGDSIYVHCTGLTGSGTDYLREGDTVEFERFQDAHDMKRGKERAINVRILGPRGAGGPPIGGRTSDQGHRFAGCQELLAPPPPAPAPAPYPKPYVGRVSRWNDDKGFGFIVHHDSQESIYVHRSGLAGTEALHEGDEVEYDRYQDPRDVERGKERAVNVRFLGGGSARTSSSSGGAGYSGEDRGYGRGGGCGRNDHLPSRQDHAYTTHSYDRGDLRAPPGAYPQKEVGTVMSWTDEKGFGFILLQGSKESIYVHRTGLYGINSLREGDAVEFERTQDQRDMERGKERAVNVQLWMGGAHGRDHHPQYQSSVQRATTMREDYGARDPGPGYHGNPGFASGQASWRAGGGRGAAERGYERGTVSAWHDEKGFGFIVHDMTKESIYVHRTGLLDIETLREGDLVEYARTQDARDLERGKERAVNVRVLSGDARGRDRSRSPRRR